MGVALSAPLVARILDASGKPIQSVDVSWSVTSGNGSVSPATAKTDASGVASAVWTLGTVAGEQQVTATAGAVRFAFRATAVAGPPTNAAKDAGDLQSGAAGSALGSLR